jgi:nitrogenase molybdenum-cofactor synthesis protein NifE
MELANMMEEKYGIPSLRVSYFGIEDMAEALYDIARFFKDPEMMDAGQAAGRGGGGTPGRARIEPYKQGPHGARRRPSTSAAFKAFSLVKAFRLIGMQVVMVGSQTGTKEDYQELAAITDPGTIIVDDANPLELTSFSRKKKWTSSSAGSRNGPLPTSSGSPSATTTMNARKCWPVSRACSTSPARSTAR